MKNVAISQSNYIPWKGYFDLIAAVDEFVLYDDMQYTRRDWRNRNQIKTPHGTKWLTVPVYTKGLYFQKIRETRIREDSNWRETHWKTLTASYGRCVHFHSTAPTIAPLYLQRFEYLSDLNHAFIIAICQLLGISTRITKSSDYTLIDGKSARLADLCEQLGATVYVSGPAARDYLDEAEFSSRGIKVSWFEYTNYPIYDQPWGEFNHAVSILDLLFCCGADASRFLRYVAPVETIPVHKDQET